MKTQKWARVGYNSTGYHVQIRESKSPIAKVLETIPCASKAEADKAVSLWLKENGLTYGGR